MGGLNVRDSAAPPVLPSQDNPMAEIAVYLVLLYRTFFSCVFAGLRIHWMFEDKNQSPFEINSVFTNIGMVALTAIAVVGVLLCMSLSRRMRDVRCYTFLKFIGSFSAFLAPFSLLIVILLPPKLNWIGYVLVCVMFGIIVTCFYLDDHLQDKRSSTFNDWVLVLVPFLIFLMFSTPLNLNRFVYRVISLSLVIENVYHLITYLLFINEKTRKPSNLEDHQLIQPDENNNHFRNNYLQVFGRH